MLFNGEGQVSLVSVSISSWQDSELVNVSSSIILITVVLSNKTLDIGDKPEVHVPLHSKYCDLEKDCFSRTQQFQDFFEKGEQKIWRKQLAVCFYSLFILS